jgi:hypothetical protein
VRHLEAGRDRLLRGNDVLFNVAAIPPLTRERQGKRFYAKGSGPEPRRSLKNPEDASWQPKDSFGSVPHLWQENYIDP